MSLRKSLYKRINKYCFRRFLRLVSNESFRPFFIDGHGLWFQTKHGFFVYSNLQDRILELESAPEWEVMETSFVLNNVKERDVFIDVGANIGYFSMLAARQRAKAIFSFEPVPKTYEMLAKNIAYNGFEGIVRTFNLALGSEEQTLEFTDSIGPKNHVRYYTDDNHSKKRTIKVRATTLDKFVAGTEEIKQMDFIKIDVEGFDYNVLLGAKNCIARFEPTVLIEVQAHRLAKFNSSPDQIFDFFKAFGYKHLCITDNAILPGQNPEDDIEKGRDFVFYPPSRSLSY